jgi:two-component system, NtrC family, sensor histidine kinase HydH
MFSILSTEEHRRIPITAAIVLGTLLLAFFLSVTAVIQVLAEYRLLEDWLTRPAPVPLDEIRALRQDIGARIIVRSVASVVLVLCTLATLWLQQRQLTVRRTLHQVKLLAYNILSSLNQGVITTDQLSIITSINSAAIDVIGVNAHCVGQPLASISCPEVPLEELCSSVTEHKSAVAERDLTLDRGGSIRRLVASALELKDMRGATIGSVIHLRDVTERMLMREQMWRMEQFASLNTLSSGLHHEIKNPITALSIHIQLLEERLRGMAADHAIAELIEIVKTEVRRLNVTLSSFRDFASLQRLDLRPIDMQEILESLRRLIGPQAAQQDVNLEVLPAKSRLPRVKADREKIEQAILNLMLNALEAMPRGGNLRLQAEAGERELRVVVRDSGSGIPKEIQDLVLRPYFSTKEHGTGLGLALTEKLVNQHLGQLDFRTSTAGTSFTITLPMSDRSDVPT